MDPSDLADPNDPTSDLGILYRAIYNKISAAPEDKKPDLVKTLTEFVGYVDTTIYSGYKPAESDPHIDPQLSGSTSENGRDHSIDGSEAPSFQAESPPEQDDVDPHTTDTAHPTARYSLVPPPNAQLTVRKRKSQEDVTTETVTATKRSRTSSTKVRKCTPKPLQLTKELKEPGDMHDITVGIDKSFTATRLQEIRGQFYDELLQLPYPEKSGLLHKPGQDPSKMYDIATAVQVTNFFFDNVMGRSGIDQLWQFILDYTPEQKEKADLGAVNRLRATSKDKKAPKNLRMFCAGLAAQMGHDAHANKLVARIEGTRRGIDTFKYYQTLCADIEENGEAIWKYIMDTLGYDEVMTIRGKIKPTTKSQGRPNASVAKDALVAITGVDRTIIDSRIENTRAVSYFVERFGEPLILLFPQSTESYLKNLGKTRLVAACDILEKLSPYITDVVNALGELVWKPYVRGAPQLPVDLNIIMPSELDTSETRLIDHLYKAADSFGDNPIQVEEDLVAEHVTGRVSEVEEE